MPPTTRPTTDRTTDHETEDDTGEQRRRSRRRYEQLLATIDANTGGPDQQQRPGITRPRIHLHLVAHGPYGPEEVRQSIRAALENDTLVEYRDEDGRRRLARRTVEGLRAIIGEQNTRGEPDVELQERCAAILRGLDDD